MTKPVKIFLGTTGLIIALMVAGMLFSAVFRVKPEDIRALNSIVEFQWYRIGFYFLIVVLWPVICKVMTKPNIDMKTMTEDDVIKSVEKQQKDYSLLKSKLKHLVLLILFFEVVVIRQFGL